MIIRPKKVNPYPGAQNEVIIVSFLAKLCQDELICLVWFNNISHATIFSLFADLDLSNTAPLFSHGYLLKIIIILPK